MNSQEKLENLSKFRETFQKKERNLNLKEFEKYFQADFHILESDIPFLEENFYLIIYNITFETLKNIIKELEYYVNVRNSTPLMSIDYEIIKDDKNIQKMYYTLYKIFKNYTKLFYQSKHNSSEIIPLIKELQKNIEKYSNYMIPLIDKMNDLIEKNIKDLDKDEKKSYESSIFN